MAPVVLTAKILEVLLEQSPHLDDPVRHALDLTEPLFVETWVIEYLRSDPGTVNRRVRVQRPHQYLDLRVHPLLLFGRVAYNGERSDSFAVQALLYVSQAR